MWKNGGIYSDLDTITLKSFESILNGNKSGFGYFNENYSSIGNGFILFTRKLHPFLKRVLDVFIKQYNGNKWAENGPMLIKKILEEFCRVKSYLDIDFFGFKWALFVNQPSHDCADLTIFPEWFFYPFTYVRDEHTMIFTPNSSLWTSFQVRVRDAYSMHYYNKLSSDLSARIDDRSFFTQKAEENCKYVFDYVKRNSLVFS